MIRRIILKADSLKSEVNVYSLHTAEITIHCDVIYSGQEFINLPIVRLLIEEIDFEDDQPDVMVSDEYCHVIPYLKPIKSFRMVLKQQLLRLRATTDGLVRWGIEEYLMQLETFSEIKTLIREVKTETNRLKPEKADTEVIRKVLSLLGKTSSADNFLEVQR